MMGLRPAAVLFVTLGLTISAHGCARTDRGPGRPDASAQRPSTGEPSGVTDGALRERHLTSDIIVQSDADVSAPLVSTIAETITQLQKELGGVGSLVIQVLSDSDAYVAATARPFGRSAEEGREYLAVPTHVVEATLGSMWVYAPRFAELASDRQRTVLIHEYFHNMQFFLSRGRAQGRGSPRWLLEGTARYVEFTVGQSLHYTSLFGVADLEDNRKAVVRHYRSGPSGTLASYEDPGRDETSITVWHDLGFLAADYLMLRHGVDKVTEDFWRELVRSDWRSAFELTFGIKIDRFYADFEQYVQQLP